METAKVLKFSRYVFGFFGGVIQKVFEDLDFKRNGIIIVEPPTGYYNTKRINPRYPEIQANTILYKKLDPIKINNECIGLYNLITDEDVKGMTVGEFLKMKIPEMTSLENINDVGEFEKMFWTNPETRR